jgi:signal transduction histidine kinase
MAIGGRHSPDRPGRLMLIFALSVGLPGLVLSYFAFRSVRAETLAEQADFQRRCESVAGVLYGEVLGRFETLEEEIGAGIDQGADSWSGDPDRAAARILERVEGIEGILMLDEGGRLVYPVDRARSLGGERDLLGIEEDLLSVMGRRFNRALEAELILGDFGRAATLYQIALPTIPGYRGQLIARNARARCLYKAGLAGEALRLYRSLATEGANHRDLNGFPLDLLASYQVAQCQLAMGTVSDAAITLRSLLRELTANRWSYGGVAESVLSAKILGQLSDEEVFQQLPKALQPDLETAKRNLDERRSRQSTESRVLALIPSIASASAETSHLSDRFVYQRLTQAEEAFLFARTTWRSPGEQRTLLFHLDEPQLLTGLYQRLDGIQKANPELTVDLGTVTSGPAPLSAPAEGVVYPLGPWLPGRTVVVTRGDETTVSAALASGRRWRVLTVVAFTLLIAMGLGMSYRAVRREIEIARMRTDFVSNVSHELRTPLATIRISAEMLSLGMVPPGNKQQEYHDTILSETERLSRLIDNVLDFARIEQGRKKYRFREGSVVDLFVEVQRVTQDFLHSSGFHLDVEVERDLPRFPFDQDALVQALLNLATNAVQYTSSKDPERRVITLSARRERDTIVLAVKDRGDGLDPNDQKRVFDKFVRGGDPLTRTVRGTGLGLSIVQHIAEAHGGVVGLISEKGVGSTFQLALPGDKRGGG